MPIPNNAVLAALHEKKAALLEQQSTATQVLQEAQAALDAAHSTCDGLSHQLTQITAFLDSVRDEEGA